MAIWKLKVIREVQNAKVTCWVVLGKESEWCFYYAVSPELSL